MPESNNSANNKRIAKNTLVLYIRMLFLMLISLYTSRVILNALGVEDYGIYNVVGGLVAMFSMISASLNASISRFLTFELGKGNLEKLKNVFSSSITIQILLAIIVIIIAETIGIWFLNYKMVIPENRLTAANWCFQFSIITFGINLISVPYNAAIIAHEKMSAFAYISILDGVSKLLIAWLIVVSPIDRLVFYAALGAVLSWIIRMVYVRYCKIFEECRFRLTYNSELLKKMFGFAGWNFWGAGSWILMTQGINILSNLFFGVTVNAARGIANQVNNAISQLVGNLSTAIDPQITKSYASNQRGYMFELICGGAKYSYFLFMLFALPLLFETHFILVVWLKNVPEYTISFVRLSIVVSMIHVISSSMITGFLATGDIKRYQLIAGGLGMLVLPGSWFLFYLGYPPDFAYIVNIVVFVLQLVYRLFELNKMLNFSPYQFVRKVLYRCFIVTAFALPLPFFIQRNLDESILRLVVVSISSVLISVFFVYLLGLNREEKKFVKGKVVTIKNNIYK